MAGWHHRLDAREFGWILGLGDGQAGLACCDSWGCKESDTTERLTWTEPEKRGNSFWYLMPGDISLSMNRGSWTQKEDGTTTEEDNERTLEHGGEEPSSVDLGNQQGNTRGWNRGWGGRPLRSRERRRGAELRNRKRREGRWGHSD